MDYSAAVLGSGVVAKLRERVSTPIISIGRDHYTRKVLSLGECFNFTAAKRLNDAIASLKVKDTRDFFKRIEPEQLALPNIGSFAFAVLGTCFEAQGVGTLDQWVEQSRAKGSPVVTFNTIKHQIAKQTTKTTQKPRPGKRQTAHATTPLAVAADRG